MRQNLIDIAKRFFGRRIMIIGDMIADVYLHGDISRISREAPVLVLIESDEKTVAGGAANVVNNVATLGGSAFAAGILGDDKGAAGLSDILGKNGVDLKGVFRDSSRRTITKTRIIAGGRATVSQQVVRIDRECSDPLSAGYEQKLLSYIEEVLPQMQGVVMSDYGSGTITPKARELILSISKRCGIPSIVDSRYSITDFAGTDYIKQNDAELAQAVGYTDVIRSEDELRRAAEKFLQRMQAKGVLVTRGEKGMMLFEADGSVHNIPVEDKSEVFDVSGAGDTCVAAFITALAAGASPREAAEISNFASGIAVRKMGTATVSQAELDGVLKKF